MSGGTGKDVYRRFVDEVVNGGDLDAIDELYSPDFVDHTRPPGAPEGLEGVRAVPRLFRGAFPDAHFTIEDMLGEGDLVATRVTGRGTHRGPFLGIEPTGRAAEWMSMGFFRFRDGLIVEHWGVPDLLHLMMQLGAVPTPPPAPPASDEARGVGNPERARLESAAFDPEESKRVVRYHVEHLFNAHDLRELGDWLAPGYCYHALGQEIYGVEGYRSTVLPLWAGFPDAHNDLLEMVAEYDRVASLWTATGTHEGEFLGIAPTGRRIEIYGITIERVRGGRRLEGWGTPDMAGLVQQITS